MSGGKKTPFSLLEVKANRARRREDGYHPNIFPEVEEMVPRGGKFAIAPSFPAAGQWSKDWHHPIFPDVEAMERAGGK